MAGEAQDLQACNLADTLLDVDVREVVEHDEGKEGRCDDEHDHDGIDRRKHRTIGRDRVIVEGDGRDA